MELSKLICCRCSLLWIAISIVLTTSLASLAGKFNPDIQIGDTAAAWKDLPGVDDKLHSMSDLKDRDFVVVVFTCNSCPYAVDYENRINRLATSFSGADSNVAVVAINVNKIEADSLPAMKKRAKERDFKFLYLFDETQQIAKLYGAVRTPEFFLLDKNRRIIYTGAMDDNAKEELVKVRYLETAIQSAMQGKAIEIAESAPVGCRIRFVAERKK